VNHPSACRENFEEIVEFDCHALNVVMVRLHEAEKSGKGSFFANERSVSMIKRREDTSYGIVYGVLLDVSGEIAWNPLRLLQTAS
jgi:hypothetical protein